MDFLFNPIRIVPKPQKKIFNKNETMQYAFVGSNDKINKPHKTSLSGFVIILLLFLKLFLFELI